MTTKTTNRNFDVLKAIMTASEIEMSEDLNQFINDMKMYDPMVRYIHYSFIVNELLKQVYELKKDSSLIDIMDTLAREVKHNLKLYIDGDFELEDFKTEADGREEILVTVYKKDLAESN